MPLVARAVARLGVLGVEVNARHDIVIRAAAALPRKVSGSAYRVVRDTSMHHGTMLISTNLDQLSHVLAGNGRRIVGKGVCSVRSPVTRLDVHGAWAGVVPTHEAFSREMFAEFSRMYDADATEVQVLGHEFVDQHPEIQANIALLKSWKWIWGQTPEFTVQDSLDDGERIHARVREGRFVSLAVGERDFTADIKGIISK